MVGADRSRERATGHGRVMAGPCVRADIGPDHPAHPFQKPSFGRVETTNDFNSAIAIARRSTMGYYLNYANQ